MTITNNDDVAWIGIRATFLHSEEGGVREEVHARLFEEWEGEPVTLINAQAPIGRPDCICGRLRKAFIYGGSLWIHLGRSSYRYRFPDDAVILLRGKHAIDVKLPLPIIWHDTSYVQAWELTSAHCAQIGGVLIDTTRATNAACTEG